MKSLRQYCTGASSFYGLMHISHCVRAKEYSLVRYDTIRES